MFVCEKMKLIIGIVDPMKHIYSSGYACPTLTHMITLNYVIFSNYYVCLCVRVCVVSLPEYVLHRLGPI